MTYSDSESRGGLSYGVVRTAFAWVLVVLVPLVGMILCSRIAAQARATHSSAKAADVGMLVAATLMVAEMLVGICVVATLAR